MYEKLKSRSVRVAAVYRRVSFSSSNHERSRYTTNSSKISEYWEILMRGDTAVVRITANNLTVLLLMRQCLSPSTAMWCRACIRPKMAFFTPFVLLAAIDNMLSGLRRSLNDFRNSNTLFGCFTLRILYIV